MRHWNNGTDHRHSKSCCDKSSPARRTIMTSMRRCVMCNDFWPRCVSSRSFCQYFEITLLKYGNYFCVCTKACTVFNGFLPYSAQMISSMRGHVTLRKYCSAYYAHCKTFAVPDGNFPYWAQIMTNMEDVSHIMTFDLEQVYSEWRHSKVMYSFLNCSWGVLVKKIFCQWHSPSRPSIYLGVTLTPENILEMHKSWAKNGWLIYTVIFSLHLGEMALSKT